MIKKIKLSQKISTLFGTLILFSVLIAAFFIVSYYQIPSISQIPLTTFNRVDLEQIILQGQVIDVGDSFLLLRGVEIAKEGEKEIQEYRIDISSQTEIIKKEMALKEKQEEIAAISDINKNASLIISATKTLKPKEKIVAKQIKILAPSFIFGQVLDISDSQISIKEINSISSIGTANYSIETDSKTNYLIKDFSNIDWQKEYEDIANLPQPLSKAGSFAQIDIDDILIVFAHQTIENAQNKIKAKEIQIFKSALYSL